MKLVLCLLSAAAAFAQSQPGFDAASLTLNTLNDQPMGDYRNGRVIIHNMSLLSFISGAYHVPNDHIFGPAWLDTVHLDLAAKTDAGTSEDASRIMLRSLLEERLKLKVHSEERMQAAYALKVAKSGPKFPESKGDPERRAGCTNFPAIHCYNAGIAAFVNSLEALARTQLDLPVIDLTELKGRYDLDLSLTPDSGGEIPSVFYALQDQLGLKVEAVKHPIDAIVVDHVEHAPVEN